MSRSHLLLSISLALLLIASCGQRAHNAAHAEEAMQPDDVPLIQAGDGAGPTGLQFRLSEGAEQPAVAALVPVAQPTPLTPTETQAILDRLPPLVEEAGDAQPFALPAESLPPPRAGQTIAEPFPPPTPAAVPEQPTVGALEVLRYAPEGEVPQAPYLSVTFNQPMVALTSHADLATQEVPVRLTPLPPGNWRWVGTKTLLFEPTIRFPMATHYTVTVPAGVQSAVGGKLASTVSWTFTTPPPKLTASYPSNAPQRRDVLMFAAFDQRITPDAVLPKVHVVSAQGEHAVRLATAEEIAADPAVKQMAAQAGAGRWLAFRATQPLPPDTTINVAIGPGIPSAEGPLTTTSTQGFAFSTYGPLRVVETRCGWGDECPPFAPWTIRFSNPLDSDAFDATMVTVEPAVPGLQVDAVGDALSIRGATQGRTRYQVTLSAAIPDLFGQTLGQDQTVTFTTTSAPRALTAPGGNFVVLDPSGPPTFSVFTVNYGRLNVQAYAVEPEDWPNFQRFQQEYYQRDQPPTPPGRLVLDRAISIKAQPDQLTETAIDLTPALGAGRSSGQFVLVIKPDLDLLGALLQSLRGQRLPTVQVWVQVTNIGLDVAVDHGQMIVWANALRDGAPLADVKLTLSPAGIAAITDAEGTALLRLPSSGANLLVARRGDDVAILPENTYWWGSGGWQQRPLYDEMRWYVFDDRQMYRPGEEVHVKGWLRRVGGGPQGDVGPISAAFRTVGYNVIDPQGNRIAAGQTNINAAGGFDLSFTIPEASNLGYAQLRLVAREAGVEDGREYVHGFQIQEFRRPEFEVKARASEGPHFVGGSAVAVVAAKYYAGGGLPNAEVTWNVSASPGSYTPPNWDDFIFGRWTPWWGGYVLSEIAMGHWSSTDGGQSQTFTGRTDANGEHALRLDFEAVTPPQPMTVRAEATVLDVNRQAWAATTTLLVHPAELYVGLRSERTFVERGQPLPIDIIVVDLDGHAIAGQPVAVRAARLEWRFRHGSWREEEAAVQRCAVESANEPVRCTFETSLGGAYRITATVNDRLGRPNQTEITRWVSGGQRPPARQVEQEQVTLIPDRARYAPGDTARILVQAPFTPAEGLLTLRRSGLVSSQRFTMSESSYTLEIPIEEGYIPNLYVQVDLVGATPRADDQGEVDPTLPKRPAYATGSLNLAVPPLTRALTLEVTPQDTRLEPGGETIVDVIVRDAADKPVAGSEVALVVVDEAVLALSNYQLADPLDVFYSQRGPDVSDYHLRGNLVLIDPTRLAQEMPQEIVAEGRMVLGAAMPAAAPMATAEMARAMETPAGFGGAAPPPIALRADFNALATFAPAIATDADGHAAVRVKLPDNLTRYRVMAVAVAGSRQFGKGEAAITARLPLMVRPSAPRFLNFGDRFELPVVVQNQTDAPLTVDVALRVSNLALTADAGQRVTVPADDRVEVRFAATTRQAGVARFQVAAVAGRWADAAQGEFPVWTPATTEAFATYGVIDSGAIAQPVIAPSAVYTQFGGLDITTSSTALQELTDAVLYLTAYPFECAEQLASRILAVAALQDVLSAFNAPGLPSPLEMNAAVARDIERLRGMQNDGGGFGFWKRGDESWPFISVHVAHALQRAREKDYAVPPETIARARDYLRTIESRFPAWYSQNARRTITAYALYVRWRMGDADTTRARALIDEVGLDKLSPEAIGWLYAVLTGDPGSSQELAAIRRHLNNRVTETAGAAHFATPFEEGDYVLLASNRRADGIILEALIGDQPQNDLIPKLVRGLLANRTRGRWMNTQENVFVLLALDRYFNTYEAETPDFVARIWLGEQYAGATTFVGRTTDYHQIHVPMAYLAQTAGAQDLIVSKEGTGRLYYRLGVRYAPTDLQLPPADHGFTVERTYLAIDSPDDVRRDSDGVWHIKAGARVRVRLTMVAEARRYHVALVDPLPAGLEALNPALAVTGQVPQDPGDRSSRFWWYWWPWYQHQNLRDERAEAFTPLLWEGVYTYSYVARATTPGDFVVPPAKAEEMYAPETFGRSASDRVIVE